MTITSKDNFRLTDNQTLYNMRIQSLAKASLGNGVVLTTISGTGLKVTEKSTGANMSVDVAAGTARINGTDYIESAKKNLIVSAAHATYPRIDLIVYDQSGSTPAIVAGTPDTYPQCPDVREDNDIPLALVYVAANDTAISNSEITNVRSGVKPECDVNNDVDYEFISSWRFPIRNTGGDTEGSYFDTVDTSYVGTCYVLAMTIPTNPISGTTMVARFCAIVSIGDAAETVTVAVNRGGTAVGETTSQSTYPQFVMSAELSTGPGNDIQTVTTPTGYYQIDAKTSNADYTAKIFAAWIEFYAKY